MATFEITSPDGRVIEITGEQAPNAETIKKIFASLPTAEPEPQERGVLSGIFHSGLKGASVGMSPKWLAGGEALAQVGPAPFDLEKRAEWQNAYNQAYEPALAKEKALQQGFEKDHPVLSFGSDLIGSMLLPVGGTVKAAKTTKDALKTGAALGGMLGSARAGFESDGDATDTAINMLGGGVLGAATGAAGGALGYKGSQALNRISERISANRLIKALETPIDKLSKKQHKILAEEVGGEDALQRLVDAAQAKGVSLAELGDTNIARALAKANMASPTARRTIANARDQYQTELADKNNQVFTETLGKKVGVQDLDALKADATRGASDLYKAAWQNKLDGKDIIDLNNNTLIRDAVNDVNKNAGLTFGGRSKVDPQSVEYWDGVKRALDDKISRFYKDGVASDPQKVAHLVEARAELVNKLDKVAPTYKAAREIYSSGYEIDNAYDLGKKVLWNNEVSTVLTKSKEFGGSMAAKDAMKMGVRDAIEEKIGSARGDNTFKDVLTPNVQKKIKALVGDKEGQKLIDYAETQFNLKQTFNKATQGSPTAERQQLVEEAIGPLTNLVQGKPVSAASQVVGKGLQKGAKVIGRATDDKNYNQVANAILQPIKATPVEPQQPNLLLRALGYGLQKSANASQRLPVVASPVVQQILNALQNK